MILGAAHHFSKSHHEDKRGVAPPYLCELVVHCLELVAQLSHARFPFRFKGGNSLLVLLEDPRRFSIDVDIVTAEPKERLASLVAEIASRGAPFSRFEMRAPKTKPWLPMVSFKLFFDSHWQPAEEAYVMLDAVLAPAPYGGIRKQVRCLDVYEAAIDCEVPSRSGLVGDKLLTIGPATLGIPLGKGKEAQRLKHVFDVSLLTLAGIDAGEVRASTEGCMAQELTLQQKSCTLAEIIDDTRAFLRAPLAFDAPPPLESVDPKSYLYEIVKGYEPFRSYVFRGGYDWGHLRVDCERVLSVIDAIA